jgi:hypothetical protein
MRNLKIRKSDYQSASQEQLSIFSDNIALKGTSKNYQSIAPQFEVVRDAATNFRNALNDAVTRDQVKIAIKNEKKALLINALNVLVFMIETHPEVSLVFILEAGFQVRAEAVTSNRNAELGAPLILRAESTGVRGELRLEAEIADKTSVTQVIYEYSADQGQTWQNGKYTKGKSFVMSQLPSINNLMIRSRATGTRERVSQWSPVLVADVF